MNNQIKQTIYKILPLIILYVFLMIIFLDRSDYEIMFTLTAAIPFIAYIFNKDPKIERVLRYVLYLLIIYLIIRLKGLFSLSYSWMLFCLSYYEDATVWDVLKWEWFFICYLQYLIYIGIVFLAVKHKKNIITNDDVKKIDKI